MDCDVESSFSFCFLLCCLVLLMGNSRKPDYVPVLINKEECYNFNFVFLIFPPSSFMF